MEGMICGCQHVSINQRYILFLLTEVSKRVETVIEERSEFISVHNESGLSLYPLVGVTWHLVP